MRYSRQISNICENRKVFSKRKRRARGVPYAASRVQRRRTLLVGTNTSTRDFRFLLVLASLDA